MTTTAQDSVFIRHAEREMRLAGLYDDDADYGGEIPEAVLNVVRAFADDNHSGGSAALVLFIVERVLRFENLTPLTDNPDEWNEVGHGMWQSQRRADAFSEDGGRTYYLLDEADKPIHESVKS